MGIVAAIPVIASAAKSVYGMISHQTDTPSGAYPNGTALNYKGDFDTKHAPGQPSDDAILALVPMLNAADLRALQNAYVGARSKAIWTDVYPEYVFMIGIASMGGDDFKRDGAELNLHNVLVGLLDKYGLSDTSGATGPATPQGTAAAVPTTSTNNPDTPWGTLVHGVEQIGSNLLQTAKNTGAAMAGAALEAGQNSSGAAKDSSAATGWLSQPSTFVFLAIAAVVIFLVIRKKR